MRGLMLMLIVGALNGYGPAAGATPVNSQADQERAAQIFRRLTGMDIHASDSRLAEMAALIGQGNPQGAAAIATADRYFYEVTLQNLTAALGSRNATPLENPQNEDFQNTFMGTVRDERDARALLYGDYLYYRVSPPQTQPQQQQQNQQQVQQQFPAAPTSFSLVDRLAYQSPQRAGTKAQASGLLTTSGWAWNYDGGTNRRAVVSAFERFLCKPIAAWRVPYLDESLIARDIDRMPGGDPKVFQKQCRTCHGSIDSMRDAFAGLEAFGERLVFLAPGNPVPKYEHNAMTYPQGHVTVDSSWSTPIATLRPELGIKPELAKGEGVRDFGFMLANSSAFDSCMTQRAFEAVCGRAPEARDEAVIESLARGFVDSGHNLKKLFQSVAATPICLEEPRVKDFRSYYFSLCKALGIPRSAYNSEFERAKNRLPIKGRPEEVSATTLAAATSIAGQICQTFSKKHGHWPQHSDATILHDLSMRLFGRELEADEQALLAEGMGKSKNKVQFVCTVLASSLEFISL